MSRKEQKVKEEPGKTGKQGGTSRPQKRSFREDCAILWRGVRIWREILPGYWTWCILCLFTDAFFPYFGIYMSAQLVNELAGDCDLNRLLILAGITAGGGFFLSLLRRALNGRRDIVMGGQFYYLESYLSNVQNRLQYDYMENSEVTLLRARINASTNAFGGGLLKIIWNLPGLLEDILHIFFSASLTVSMFAMVARGEFTGILRFINSPYSALIIILLILLDAVCSIYIANNRTLQTEKALDGLAELNTRHSAYMGLRGSDMTVFNLNRIVLEDFRKYSLRPAWIERTERIELKYDTLSAFLNGALNLAIYLFVAIKAFMGAFGIGNFILYQGTVRRFVNAVSGFAKGIGILRNNNDYLLRLYEFLDLPNDMYQGSLAVEKRDDLDYEIEFRDVSFRYPRTEAYALRHVNMKFRMGEKLAIVGENGSGKTTFIKLLCRLYDPTEGKILLNGIDITRYRYDEYLSLFSVVFQDYTLFGFSLGENVSASTEYDEARVRKCLLRAGLGDKLSALDAQAAAKSGENAQQETKKDAALESFIGRGYDVTGVDFSGGEKQKIALARSLYKEAPFVILDEPTAALDPVAEAAVYEDFNKIAQDKTTVFISHRLSSCRFCDNIIVFDHGQIIQRGGHDELVADTEGKYCQLWNAQAKYYS